MLRKLINTYLNENIKNKNDVAILFSGGMDSLSILLSCLDVGIKPNLYSFKLSNFESDDIKKSRKVAKIFNLKLTEITIEKTEDVLLRDINYIIKKYKVKKKTQIQCIQPFLHLIPHIKENIILTGLCADDLYGTARSVSKHYNNYDLFNKIRKDKHDSLESSSYCYIKDICDINSKKLIAPYKESFEISDMILNMTFKELNSPKQKNIMYVDYKHELEKYRLYRRNSNLQCNSKIREWHDELLLNETVNIGKYKRIVGIYNYIYNKIN